MFLPKYFNLKKEKETEAGKIYFGIFPLCIILGLCSYFFMKDTVLMSCVNVVLSFIGLSYCVLGHQKCYKVRNFKGHKVLRWIVLLIAMGYCILGVVLYFQRETDIETVILFVVALLMAITAVRNGYAK